MNSQTLMMTPGTRTVAAEPSRKLLVICKQVTMQARCVSICIRAGRSVCVCVSCPARSAVRLISVAAAHLDDFIWCRSGHAHCHIVSFIVLILSAIFLFNLSPVSNVLVFREFI